jgi:hypothetical protein
MEGHVSEEKLTTKMYLTKKAYGTSPEGKVKDSLRQYPSRPGPCGHLRCTPVRHSLLDADSHSFLPPLESHSYSGACFSRRSASA